MFKYKDLFFLLKEKECIDDILNLKFGRDVKYEPQESIFRLFSCLKLFDKLKGFCIGNFNTQNIERLSNKNFLDFMNSSLKESGDKSDTTFLTDTELIATTSKNNDSYGGKIGKLDIGDIELVFNEYSKLEKYKNIHKKICFIVNDKKEFIESIENSHTTSSYFKKYSITILYLTILI